MVRKIADDDHRCYRCKIRLHYDDEHQWPGRRDLDFCPECASKEIKKLRMALGATNYLLNLVCDKDKADRLLSKKPLPTRLKGVSFLKK